MAAVTFAPASAGTGVLAGLHPVAAMTMTSVVLAAAPALVVSAFL